MTLLGKVFTGLIFLLSILFFSFAVALNASHVDQKKLAADYQAEAQSAKQKNTELASLLETTKSELAIELSARRSALGALQTHLGVILDDLQKKEEQLQAAQAAFTQFTSIEKQSQAELITRTEESENLRKQIVDAREVRNQLFQRLVQARDQFNRLQGIYQSESQRESGLQAQLSIGQ